MGKGSRIEQDEVNAFTAGRLNAVNQLVLGIALQVLQVMAAGLGLFKQLLVDLFQRQPAIGVRLATAEQIQIGAMQDKNGGQFRSSPAKSPLIALIFHEKGADATPFLDDRRV
jgi:hypothetical protein